ncbi:MAG: transposase [Anaerolineaceae bacterium]|nr:MAG: transposase [Anaerolineaceae bacterium]
MLRPENNSDIPERTQLVTRNAFPKGSIIMTMRDELGPIFEDGEFAGLYSNLGQPAESPGRLALVTVMQFIENLTDRQAAQAVRGRIDWEQRVATCPNGKTSSYCSERKTWRGTPNLYFSFRSDDCQPCTLRRVHEQVVSEFSPKEAT